MSESGRGIRREVIRDVLQYVREHIQRHRHDTGDGSSQINTNRIIKIRTAIPFPPLNVRSRQLVRNLNVELLAGWTLQDIISYIATNGGDLTAKYLLTEIDALLPNAIVVGGYPFVDDDLAAIAWAKITDIPTEFPIIVSKAATPIGTRPEINLIQGSGMTITVADDVGNDRVNITLVSSGGAGEVTFADALMLMGG